MVKKKLGAVIRSLRESRGMSQAQLAELIGKSPGTVGQYERGEIWPTCEGLFKIIDFFDVDLDIFASNKKSQYDTETLLMLHLFSQMNNVEKKGVTKFLKGLAQVSSFMENHAIVDSEDEETT